MAEVEIEAGPFMGVWVLGRWHSSPLPPLLKGFPGFYGNLRHGIMKDSRRPPRAETSHRRASSGLCARWRPVNRGLDRSRPAAY